MRFLIYVFGIWGIFTVFVTVFALSARKDEVRALPKGLWVLICLGVPFIGGILYLTLGRPLPTPDDYSGRGGSTRTVAPDDDPDFLRRLAKRLRDENPAADDPEHGNSLADGDSPANPDSADDDGDDSRPRGGDLPNV